MIWVWMGWIIPVKYVGIEIIWRLIVFFFKFYVGNRHKLQTLYVGKIFGIIFFIYFDIILSLNCLCDCIHELFKEQQNSNTFDEI